MDIKGNEYGGLFTVEASPEERTGVLEAIGRQGLRGVSREELRHDPLLGRRVVEEVAHAEEWDRRTLEIVGTTLVDDDAELDAQALAGHLVLQQQIQAALEEAYPRQ